MEQQIKQKERPNNKGKMKQEKKYEK